MCEGVDMSSGSRASNERGCDFAVIGGGILGITIARALQIRHADARIIVLEKETQTGQHASGRNSGVLHAGFYYDADSLKARFSREGNRRLTAYCRERGLSIRACGKLVVVQNDAEQAVLDELVRRGHRNDIPLQVVTAAEARDIEPRVRTLERALFSPTTASIDPLEIVRSLQRDAAEAGVRFRTGVRFLGRGSTGLRTSAGTLQAGYVVNAAGLQADAIARHFGFSRRYGILPFKGLYLVLDEPVDALRVHVYPVPDLRNPFLGVHLTVTVDGGVKVGPSAMPAFWREQYAGWENFQPREFLQITARQLGLIASSRPLRALAVSEMRKRSRAHMARLAARLVAGVEPSAARRWGRPGIRAQLIDFDTQRLVMDFKLEGDDRSLHVLNAVSPAFTCSLPFAEHVCDEIERLRR